MKSIKTVQLDKADIHLLKLIFKHLNIPDLYSLAFPSQLSSNDFTVKLNIFKDDISRLAYKILIDPSI